MERGKKCHSAFTVTHFREKNEQAALCVLYSEGPFIQKWRDVFKQAQEAKQDAERESTACFQCRRDFLYLSWHHNVLEVRRTVSVLIAFWNIYTCTQIAVIAQSCSVMRGNKVKGRCSIFTTGHVWESCLSSSHSNWLNPPGLHSSWPGLPFMQLFAVVGGVNIFSISRCVD